MEETDKKNRTAVSENEKNHADEITRRLEEVYPESECALKYQGEDWKLLVMGILSAQCTDVRVNAVCEDLFRICPTARDIAECETEKIENIIKSCGLYKTKAKNIKGSCILLCGKYGGKIPRDITIEELLEFPGVGRKIANLLIGDLFGRPAIVTDTHCIRISARLGLTDKDEKNPLRTEKRLCSLIEPSKQSDFCHRLVMFGREYCTARSPGCTGCPLSDLCRNKNQ